MCITYMYVHVFLFQLIMFVFNNSTDLFRFKQFIIINENRNTSNRPFTLKWIYAVRDEGSCPGQRKRQRPAHVSKTGVRYNSLL